MLINEVTNILDQFQNKVFEENKKSKLVVKLELPNSNPKFALELVELLNEVSMPMWGQEKHPFEIASFAINDPRAVPVLQLHQRNYTSIKHDSGNITTHTVSTDFVNSLKDKVKSYLFNLSDNWKVDLSPNGKDYVYTKPESECKMLQTLNIHFGNHCSVHSENGLCILSGSKKNVEELLESVKKEVESMPLVNRICQFIAQKTEIFFENLKGKLPNELTIKIDFFRN